MFNLIASTVFSSALCIGVYYFYKRNKRRAAQPLEPVALPDMTQGSIDDKPYVIITEDRILSLYFKTVTPETPLNEAVRQELSATYDIGYEDGRLAIHARHPGETPIVADATRLLCVSA